MDNNSHRGIAIDPQFSEQYDVGRLLGKGAFSQVYQVNNKRSKESFAVKIIRKEVLGKDEKQRKRIDREIDILTKVEHPNIVRMYDLIETPNYLYLVMELVTGGELFDKIVAKGSYSEKEACLVIKNVVSAIQYLHDHKITHRDLKPENLLCKGGDDTHVMISDFGLSRILGDNSIAFTACGTPYYVAPEVVSGQGYSKEVDLWSIGVITYFLLAGFPPFMGETLPEIVEQILNADFDYPAPYWDNISQNAKDFISKLLVTDKSKRLTAETALTHPWLQNLSNASDRPFKTNPKKPKPIFQ